MVQELYTPNELSEILKIDVETIRRFLREDKIKGVKIGHHWRVKESDLKDFIEQGRREVK